MKIEIYDDAVQKLVKSLEKKSIAKVLRTIDLLEHFGHHLGMPHSKKIGTNLYELRIRGEQEVRIFYIFRKNIVLIHGFIKKSNKIPLKELSIAKQKIKCLDYI